jgi:phage-related protein
MLNSFVKKSARTPEREREIAVTRMKEIKRGNA